MARQSGILKLNGSLGGLSFYRHKHYGWLVRKSNPVSAERIKKAPEFARMRENGTEFGMASRAAKLLRHALHSFLHDLGTTFLDNRTMQLMLGIKQKDTLSKRGQRNVATALGQDPTLLGGFELHATSKLDQFLGQMLVVNALTGSISLTAFKPYNIPKGATHIALTAFCGRLDFTAAAKDILFSETILLPLDGLCRDVVLIPGKPQGSEGIAIYGMKVVFMQEKNGELYSLQTGAAKIFESHEADAEEEITGEQPFVTYAENHAIVVVNTTGNKTKHTSSKLREPDG